MIDIVNRLRSERGAVELLVAFALVAILGITALVVDIGNAKQQRRNFQTGADSGSLAGAQELATSAATARTFAAEYALDSVNQARPSGMSTTACPSDAPIPGTTVCYLSGNGAMVYVTTPCTSATVCRPPANGTSPLPQNLINVKICQTLRTTFARVLGINTTRVCNSATADITPGTSVFPCAVCVMSAAPDPALHWGGNASWVVEGGPIVVNSSSSGGVAGNGSGGICDDATIHGGACTGSGAVTWYGCTSGTCPVNGYQPDPTSQPAPVPDPLAFLPTPTFTTPAGNCTAGVCTPGVYTSAITGDATLQPGTYIFKISGGGTAFDPGQHHTITGAGVTIYLACATYPTKCTGTNSDKQTTISFNNGTLTISAPTSGNGSLASALPADAVKGLAIYMDRKSTASIIGGNGNGTINMKGTIYGLNGILALGGTHGGSWDSAMVVGRVDLQGTPDADLENPADQVQMPPTASAINLIG